MLENKDNITILRNRGTFPWKRILVLALCVLLVTAGLVLFLFHEELNLDAVGRWFTYLTVRDDETFGISTFDAHSSNRYAPLGKGFAVASVAGLETFGSDGSDGGTYSLSMENPAIRSGKQLTLCFDVGGKNLFGVHEKDGKVLELSSDNGFYDADVSSGDTVCTASLESGYKTVLRVYDKNLKETYRWFSATRYMPLCAVSPSGKYLAAISLGQAEGNFESSLYLFTTDSETPLHIVSLGSELVYDLRFTEEERLTLVTEGSLRTFDLQGRELGRFSYHGLGLTDFDLCGDGFAVLAMNKYKTETPFAVLTVDETGAKTGEFIVRGNLLDISANRQYTAILTSEELIICTRGLKVYARVSNSWLASHVLMRGDGTAIVLTGSGSAIYIP